MVFSGSTSTTNSGYNSIPYTSYDTDLYSYRPRGSDEPQYSGGNYIGSFSNADIFITELFNPPVYGYSHEKGLKTVRPITIAPPIEPTVINLGSDLPDEAITSPEQLAEWVKNHPATADKPRYNFLDFQGFESTTTRRPLQSGFLSIPTAYNSGNSYGLMNSLTNATTGFGTGFSGFGTNFGFSNPSTSIGLGFGTIGNGSPIGSGIGIGLGSSSPSYPFNNNKTLDSILKNFDGSLGSGDTYFGDYMLFMGSMNQSIQSTSSPLALSNPFGGLGSLWSLTASGF